MTLIRKIRTKLTNCVCSYITETDLSDEMLAYTDMQLKNLENLIKIQNIDPKKHAKPNKDILSSLVNIIEEEWNS